jgi:hypothetical protein
VMMMQTSEDRSSGGLPGRPLRQVILLDRYR